MEKAEDYPRLNLRSNTTLVVNNESDKFKFLNLTEQDLHFISHKVLDQGEMITLDLDSSKKLSLTVLDGAFEWLCEQSVKVGYQVKARFSEQLHIGERDELMRHFAE